MKLKINQINTAAGILSDIKLNRIADRDVKKALLTDYLALRKVAKGAESKKSEIIDKFQEDWKDELSAVQSFRSQGRPVIGHLDYLEAERDANEVIKRIYDADAEIDLVPTRFDAIMDFSEDVTLEQIAFLVEVGILEEQ